ncbi:MAG: hypothetical protein ISR36_05020 [Gammaproteobacteria bacterium]|nr:hypothetical protein [Gammaproteobacteria bacterium]RZO21633.1 MAG: hypothetical protein EVB05_07535 [Candidatus Thioglobus sp.]
MNDILKLLVETPMQISQMVGPLYPGLDLRLIGGARLSILASLRYLMTNGAIGASDDSPLISSYQISV